MLISLVIRHLTGSGRLRGETEETTPHKPNLILILPIAIVFSKNRSNMEQKDEGKPPFEGWVELPVELRDLILFWTTRGSPSMTAVIPFVCREILHRRSSWTLPSPPPTKRTFETKRDLNVKIAVDAASCGWLGVLQWLRGM